MEITFPMIWALFVAVVAVVVGVVVSKRMTEKSSYVSEKTLKLILKPLEINGENILKELLKMEKRIAALEEARTNVISSPRIQRN